MSAIAPDAGEIEVIKVLITLHPDFDTLDFTGPLEILSSALHNPKDRNTEAFDITIVGGEQHVMSSQGLTVQAQISFKEAHARLAEFDVLVIPGGGTAAVLKDGAEPIPLIQAFAEHQQKDPGRERTLFSICTGSLFLAQAGVLQGLAATTHPDFYIQLEELCQVASAHTATERTDVMEERYVVNNARYDIDDEAQNPFVISKEEYIQSRKERRRSSIARKGSNAWRDSNNRRESNARRAAMRLGGMRVITAGGITSGFDAALYLVCAMVSVEAAEEVARRMQYTWVKGVVVDAIDV